MLTTPALRRLKQLFKFRTGLIYIMRPYLNNTLTYTHTHTQTHTYTLSLSLNKRFDKHFTKDA